MFSALGWQAALLWLLCLFLLIGLLISALSSVVRRRKAEGRLIRRSTQFRNVNHNYYRDWK